MYEVENVAREVGRVVASEGQSLRMADGTLGQTHDMYQNGYAAIGFSGYTEAGQPASIPKPDFHEDKQKNIAIRETKPRYIRVAFDQDDDIVNSIAGALMVFYHR